MSHSRSSSSDRPPRPSSSTPLSRPGVLEISLNKPSPLPKPTALLDLLTFSEAAESSFNTMQRQSISQGSKPEPRSPSEASLSDSSDDQSLSHKMQDLTCPARPPKRKVTTVLMAAPPASTVQHRPNPVIAEKELNIGGNEGEMARLREELKEEREKSARLVAKCR